MAPSSEPPLSVSTQNGSGFEMEKMSSEEEKTNLDIERADQDHSDDAADVPASPRSVHGFSVRSLLSQRYRHSLIQEY